MFASVISSYKLAKVGFDKISQFRHAPDVMKQTCDLCATLLEPMMVAEALATRHASLRIVGPALRFAHTTVSQCNRFTSELGVGVVMGEGDEGDDEEGGESSSGWAAYLISRTGGATKLEQLGEMLTQLARASTALQLALAAVLASLPPRFAYSPFRYVREAVEAARSGYLQLEMGRQRSMRLCAGELWQRGIALSGRGGKRRADVMARLYDCTVSLTNDAEGEKSGDSEGDEGEETAEEARPVASESAQDVLFLRFLPQSDDESSGGEQMTVPLDETVRLRRCWASELSQVMELKQSEEFVEIVGEDALCYELIPSTKTGGTSPASNLVLVYRNGDAFAAEAFEMIVSMAIFTRQPNACALALADVFDSPGTPKFARFLDGMQKMVGPLEGVPQSASSRPDSTQIASALLTPLRGLALGDASP